MKLKILYVILLCAIVFGVFVDGQVYGVAMDVKLWCGFPSKVVYVGGSVSYDFSVSYVGPLSFVDISFVVDGLPRDWSYRIVYGGFEVNGVRLMNKTSTSLNLIINVPEYASIGDYNFCVIAKYDYPPYASYLGLNVIVKSVVRSLSLSCMFPAKVVEVGGSISFDVKVKYYGFRDVFKLDVPDLPKNWSVGFYYGSDEIILLSLGDGEEALIKVRFKIPEDALIGDYNLTLSVYSSFVKEDLKLNVRVKPSSIVTRGIKLLVDYPAIDVEAGRTVYFTLNIKNIGLVDEVVYLNLTDKPSGWSFTFRVAGKVVRSLLLPAGSTANVVLEAVPSPYIKIGDYKFSVQVYSEDRVLVQKADLSVKVIGSYSLSVTFPEFPALYFTITSGESKTFTVTIENTGFLNVTNVYVSISVPSALDWRVDIEPKKIILLRPNEKANFKVSVYVSTIVSAGDYFITVKAVSDQVSSLERDIRVTVTKPTEWGYIGFGVVIIAIVAVFLVFRRFGRK